MRRTKGKRKIRYGKLFLFLIIVFTLLFLLAVTIRQGYKYAVNYFSFDNNDNPSYYLLVGIDNQPVPQADAIIVAALNHKREELTLISIPANTLLNKDENKRLLLKESYKEDSIETTRSAVENLLHTRITHYAVFDYNSFQNLLDNISPVELYVEKMMNHDNEEGESEIFLNQGYQSLDTTQSLAYLRYVDETDGEIGRIQREQRFLKQLLINLQKNTALFNWGLARYYWSAYDTNLSNSDVSDLAYDITKLSIKNCRFLILPGEMQRVKNQEIWITNPVGVQKTIALTLNEE